MAGAVLVLLLGLFGAAQAAEGDDPRWYVGQPVVQVSLEAAEGSLPKENLEPLLRVRQGASLDPGEMRQDIGLLYRAGDFAAVEAVVEPWISFEELDEGEVPVRVVYRVQPPDRVHRVKLRGTRGAARRTARRSLAVHRDDALFGPQDIAEMRSRVAQGMAAEGWPDAEVQIRTVRKKPRESDVIVEVDAGPPATHGELSLVSEAIGPDCRRVRRRCPLSQRQVRRWLRRSGVAEGRRVQPEVFDQALTDLREHLIHRGWLQARIRYAAVQGETPGDPEPRTITVEAGPRLTVALDDERTTWRRRLLPGRVTRSDARWHRRTFRGEPELLQAMGFFGGERLDDDALSEAQRRLEEHYQERGFAAVDVHLEAVPQGDDLRLELAVDPGPRHRLGRLKVEGAQALPPGTVAGAMKEADADVLGDRRYSEAGVRRGLDGAASVYRGQGFLDAELSVANTQVRKPVIAPWLFPRRRGVRVALQVQVVEGPQTTLSSLETVGGDGLEDEIIAKADPALVGGAFSRTRLEDLARQVARAYQAEGHLNADARVDTTVDRSLHAAQAVLTVTPGPVVRLRSVVVRGNRRTRRHIITRELQVEVGQPLTPRSLGQVRSDLYALDLFRFVSPELVGDDDRSRDLLITLEEKPNILLEVGGRVSTDEGVLATGRAAHRNLGGLGHSISLLGQVGYAWLGDEWRVDSGTPVWQLATRYTAPYVPGRGHQLVLEVLLREQAQEPTFRIQRSGALLGVKSRWSSQLNTFVDYRVQFRELRGVDPGGLVCGDPWFESLGAPGCDLDEITLPSTVRYQGGPELLVLYDRRNDPFNPTRGTFLQTQLQVADGLNDSVVFFRGDLRAEQFVGLGPVVLDLFARAGAGHVPGDKTTLPMEDRFYLGGGGSMRGFTLNSVGPANFSNRPELGMPGSLDPVIEGMAVRDNPNQWVSTGGDAVLQGTVELRVPWTALGLQDWDSTAWVLFSDVGKVMFIDPAIRTTSIAREIDPPFRYSVGFGIRQNTPIGPAALEIGFNPDPLVSRDEAGYQLHLSLGEL
jgi:outer membrane protein assembly complex protein YaeT